MPESREAPDFELTADDESLFKLSDHRGKSLLLVFYPGDDTPVCTAQLCDYRDGIGEFSKNNVEIIGISSDSAESHRDFKLKHELPFVLLSDPDYKIAREYGVKDVFGIRRAVFLIDEAGLIQYSHREKLPVFRRKKEEILFEINKLKFS